MMQNIDIWVSGGSHDAPYYRFYRDIEGDNELPELVFTSNSQYTFHRLNKATSHPFYIALKNQGPDSAQSFKLFGDGNSDKGITGEENFTLQIFDLNNLKPDIEYYCTSHSLMRGAIAFKEEAATQLPSAVQDTDLLKIGRLYTAAFGRKPDEAGLQYWINAVSDPLISYKDVSQNFVDSPEFSAIAAPEASNDVFTSALYQNVLGRDPDPSGLGYWTSALDSGAQDRADVLMGFANSQENIALYETLA